MNLCIDATVQARQEEKFFREEIRASTDNLAEVEKARDTAGDELMRVDEVITALQHEVDLLQKQYEEREREHKDEIGRIAIDTQKSGGRKKTVVDVYRAEKEDTWENEKTMLVAECLEKTVAAENAKQSMIDLERRMDALEGEKCQLMVEIDGLLSIANHKDCCRATATRVEKDAKEEVEVP